MIDDTSVNVYLPKKGNRILNPDEGKKIFISKTTDSSVDYYCFDVEKLRISKIDNILRYLISHRIHSLEKINSRRKLAFINLIGKAIDQVRDDESINYYRMILTQERKSL